MTDNEPEHITEINRLIASAKSAIETNLSLATTIIEQAISISKKHNCLFEYGIGISLRGHIERTKGNFAESLDYYLQARELFTELKKQPQIATTCNNIGIVYTSIGNFSLALESYHQALLIQESLGDKTALARIMNNMGVVYDAIDEDEKAMESYNNALAINEELKNDDLIARNYCNIGAIHRNRKEYERALLCFEKAVAFHQTEKDKSGLALNYGNMGVVCEDMGDYPRALDYAMKALTISHEIKDKDMIAFNATTVGNIYSCMGEYEKAHAYMEEAERVSHEIGSLLRKETVYSSLTRIYEEQEKWKEALQSYRQLDDVKNQMSKADTQKKAITMEMQKKLASEEAIRKTTEKILHNILPKKIAERIKNGEEEIIERFDNCSVLFADMVGFTKWSEKKNVTELGAVLNHIFSMFDSLANELGIEKIKTIGDAYMCVSGLPEPCTDHAERMAKMALAMNEKIAEEYPGGKIKLRVGIHCGEVVAGVIGKNKYAYDLWGDTVNTASRMESHGVPEKIQVSDSFKNLLEEKFNFELRGEVELKGKGKMNCWILKSAR